MTPIRSVRRGLTVVLACIALAVGITIAASPAEPASAAGTLPCDIYGSASTPCVAAFSSTRALYSGYNGPLYQVRRASDGATADVRTLSAGGYANSGSQDSFCASTSCTIPRIYDQTANHNDLTVFPRLPDGQQGTDNSPANATALPITLNGNRVYGIYMPPRVSYRRAAANTVGTARGSNPESIYMVASGTNVNNSCCSDFGNVEARQTDDLAGTMDTVNLSTLNGSFRGARAYGYGPWVQNDLENGVFQGYTPVDTRNHGNPSEFVTAMTRNNGTSRYSLKGADATNGTAASAMTTWYDGSLPNGTVLGPAGQSYTPMRLQGSIVLGAGGDNSNAGTASFFEGVMTSGFSSDAADNQVQANIAAQHYDGANSGGGPGSTITHGGKCVDVGGDDKGGNARPVQLWDCLPNAADQHWTGSAYGIHTLGTMSRCLDAVGNGTANFTKVELYDCNDAVGGQKWIARADGTLFNPQSGRCLDDPNGVLTNGTALQLYDCNGNQAQQFTVTGGVPFLPAIQPSSHEVGNPQNCVDVAGDDVRARGQAVQTWPCYSIVTERPEAQDQKWIYHADTQTVTSLGFCLDVAGNATANLSKLEIWDCLPGGGAQKFVFRADGTVFNPQSGRCLDVNQGTHDVATLQLYDCIGGDAQHFTLN